jgi:HEAT repeat protein
MSFLQTLFGSPDVSKLKSKRNIGSLVRALRYKKDANVRREAAEALGTFAKRMGALKDNRSLEPFIGALQDSDPGVRMYSARALGELNDGRAMEPLITAVKDSDPGVRREATNALLAYKDARAVEPFIALLQDSDADVRRLAALGLVEFKDPRAVESCISMLQNGDANIRKLAASTLGEFMDSRAVEPLIAAFLDSDPGVRLAAIQAAGKLKDGRAVGPLTAALRDRDPSVRSAAAEALDHLAWKPAKDQNAAWYWVAKEKWAKVAALGESAFDPLVTALQDSNQDVVCGAAGALVSLKDERAVEALIKVLEETRWIVYGDQHSNRQRDKVHTVIALMQVLAKTQDPRAIQFILETIRKYPTVGSEWEPAVEAMCDSALNSEPLVAVLKIPGLTPRTKEHALQVLEKRGWQAEGVDERAFQAMIYKDWQGVEALGAEASPALIQLLEDYNFRDEAIRILGKIGDGRAAGPLMKKMRDIDDPYFFGHKIKEALEAILERTPHTFESETLTALVNIESDTRMIEEYDDKVGGDNDQYGSLGSGPEKHEVIIEDFSKIRSLAAAEFTRREKEHSSR